MVEKERERKRNELGLRKCTGVAPELRLFPAKFFFFLVPRTQTPALTSLFSFSYSYRLSNAPLRNLGTD